MVCVVTGRCVIRKHALYKTQKLQNKIDNKLLREIYGFTEQLEHNIHNTQRERGETNITIKFD